MNDQMDVTSDCAEVNQITEFDTCNMKYEKLKNYVGEILKNEEASCIAVHKDCLAIGTTSGKIFILDHSGNIMKVLSQHALKVNQICFDESGKYICSCSVDQKVIVFDIYKDKYEIAFSSNTNVSAVALEPKFSDSSSRRIITGDHKIFLHDRKLIGYKKSVLLKFSDSEFGEFINIQWNPGNDRVVACSTKQVLILFDLSSGSVFHVMSKCLNHTRCNLFWKDESTLFIGWGNDMRVCDIEYDQSLYLSASISFAEIIDHQICGISSKGNHILVFAIDQTVESNESAMLWVIEKKYDYESNNPKIDRLKLLGTYRCSVDSFHVGSLPEEIKYFILAPIMLLSVSSQEMAQKPLIMLDSDSDGRSNDNESMKENKAASQKCSSLSLVGNKSFQDKLLESFPNDNESFHALMTRVKHSRVSQRSSPRCSPNFQENMSREPYELITVQRSILQELQSLQDILKEGNIWLKKLVKIKQLSLELKYHDLDLDLDRILQ